jgi:hypothetical protein
MVEKILERIFCMIEPYIQTKNVTFDAEPILKGQVIEAKYGVTFKNIGTTDATINGFPLLAGDPPITFPVDRNEVDRTKYTIKFTGGTGEIWMIRKQRN